MSYYANPYKVMDVPNEYPLHFAARKGQVDSVRKLLAERFDPNTANIYGLTPLHLACQHGFVAMCKLLLEYKADKFWTPSPTLAGVAGTASSSSSPTPFQTAISQGHLNVLQVLLRGEHVDVRDRGHTALHWAVVAVRPLLVAWLLQQGANPNARVENGSEKTPIHLLRGVGAFREASSALAVLKLLAKYGADLTARDAGGQMALHGPHNDPQLVQTCIERGVDVNATDGQGKTALYYACGGTDSGGDQSLVQWLLDHGAKTELPDNKGITPLSHAVRQGAASDLLLMLVQRGGANPTRADATGQNPLHALLASRVRPKETKVLFLLQHLFLPAHGNVNAQTRQGWTALHYAVYYNCFQVVQVLLEHGAVVQTGTLRGHTPLHLVGLKNYDIAMGQEEELIRQALNVEITRKTQRLPRMPWDTAEAPQWKPDIDDDNSDDVVDDSSVVSNHGLPWKVRNRAIYRLLLKRGASCTTVDADGNLPFFLAASTEWMDATFAMLRMAAKQGLFESKNQKSTATTEVSSTAADTAEDSVEDTAGGTDETLRKRRRVDV